MPTFAFRGSSLPPDIPLKGGLPTLVFASCSGALQTTPFGGLGFVTPLFRSLQRASGLPPKMSFWGFLGLPRFPLGSLL